MPDIVTQHNIAAYGDLKRLSDHWAATAGGSNSGVTFTGSSLDRMGFSNGSMPRSALVGVIYEAKLASGATLAIAFAVQDSADNSTFADFQTAAPVTYGTGPSGGGIVTGQANLAVDLTNARRYVRVNAPLIFSATVTDTAYADTVGFFAGFDRLAAPNT